MSFFRVSSSSNFVIFKNLLGFQNNKVNKLSEQLVTQKRVNRPSDDPAAAKTIAGLKEGNSRIEQFFRNLNRAETNWAQIESAVGDMHSLLVRAKELAIQGNNETLGDSEREALAEEVNQLSQQMLSLGNTQIAGEYIFAGYATDSAPFELAAGHPSIPGAATYNGDENTKSIEINEGSNIEIQLRMDDVLTGTGAPAEDTIFDTLARLELALRDNNTDDDDPDSVGEALGDLDVHLRELQGRLANIGGKSNRIDKTRERLENQKVLNQSFLEKLEGVDVAEVAFEFQKAQISLQAVVNSAGSVLNQPSLIDFIR